MNEELKTALDEAGMSAAVLARKVGVAVKTAERWIAAEGRAPHPETRMRVAEVLGVSADSLWPDKIRERVKLGADREIVQSYSERRELPRKTWTDLIDGSRKRIVMAGYTSYFLWLEQPRIMERLREKSAAGCEILFLLGDPDSQLTRDREELERSPMTVSTRIEMTLQALRQLGPLPGLQARYSDSPAHLSASVFIFDDELLYMPHIGTGLGHESPVLHLRRLGSDGLFAKFATHFEVLWGLGREVPLTAGTA